MQPDPTDTSAGIVAERAVLGSVLRDPRTAAQVLGSLTKEDFAVPRHRDLFALFVELEDRSMASSDIVTVATELERRGQLEGFGGQAFLAQLAEAVPSVAYLEHHVDAVFQNARRRRLADATRLAQMALESGEDTDETAEKLEATVLGVRARRSTGGGIVSAREAWQKHLDTMRSRVTASGPIGMVPTPLSDLNDMLGGGFHPGELIVVAGRPGMGKSMFSDAVVDEAGKAGPTFYVTIEMTLDQQMQRAGRRHTPEHLMDARRAWGKTAEAYLQSAQAAGSEISASQVYYLFDAKADVAKIRGQAMNLKREKRGLKLLAIDYLQLIDTPNSRGNRQQDVAEITRQLKMLAGELHVPLVLLAQLNRETGKREDKRPQLTDLRESGAIEQDANVVILLHRPGYYDEKAKSSPDEVIVAKNRDGEPGTVYAKFDPLRSRWTKREPFQADIF